MNELQRMFRYPDMMKAAVFCTATFALTAVLFKNSFVLVPHVCEIRLASALLLPYGVFFGPAGAIGCALGNLIGDFGGSLTWLTPIGMLANFIAAWLPYQIWEAFAAPDESLRPSLRTVRNIARLLAAGAVSVTACAALLAIALWGSDPATAASVSLYIFLNNAIATLLPGIPLFWLLTRLPSRFTPGWKNMMSAADRPPPADTATSRRAVLAVAVTLLFAVTRIVYGLLARHFPALPVLHGPGFLLPRLAYLAFLAWAFFPRTRILSSPHTPSPIGAADPTA